jgi:hypothetical protein
MVPISCIYFIIMCFYHDCILNFSMLNQFGESDVHLSSPAIFVLVHKTDYLEVPLYFYARTLFQHWFRVDFIHTRIDIFCLLALSFGIRIPISTRWPQRYLSCAAQTPLQDLHSQEINHGCPTKPPPSMRVMRPVSKELFQLCTAHYSIQFHNEIRFVSVCLLRASACCAREREMRVMRPVSKGLFQLCTAHYSIRFHNEIRFVSVCLLRASACCAREREMRVMRPVSKGLFQLCTAHYSIRFHNEIRFVSVCLLRARERER